MGGDWELDIRRGVLLFFTGRFLSLDQWLRLYNSNSTHQEGERWIFETCKGTTTEDDSGCASITTQQQKQKYMLDRWMVGEVVEGECYSLFKLAFARICICSVYCMIPQGGKIEIKMNKQSLRNKALV